MNKAVIALFVLLLVSAAAFLSPTAVRVHAQSGSLPLGTVIASNLIIPCSDALNGSLFAPGMSCTTISVNCPNAQPLSATYGWSIPSNPKGTVVILSGGPGTSPAEYGGNELGYASSYQSNYIVLQLEWDSAWEDPSNGNGGSILTAACRPATFLNWVNGSSVLHPTGKAMCAQGSSAGAGAVAYSLTWYGAGSYMTNVELLSGPELAQIDSGCTVTPPTLTICGLDSHGNKQYGCTPATSQWNDSAAFVANYTTYINTWSGLNGCTQPSGQGNLPAWQQMSIVDGSSGSVSPVFNYPTTKMHGWVCASYKVDQNNKVECTKPHCPNNSAAEGDYYYTQFSNATGPVNFALTGVLSCVQEEGVTQGIDPDSNGPASAAIGLDMNNNCVAQ